MKRITAMFFLTFSCAGPDTRPPDVAEVFAPGVVSLDTGNVYRGALSPDETEFYFFRKLREDAEDYRIYVTRRRGGTWSPPERLDLGGDYSDLYPTVSPDGSRMVFTSYRPVPGDTSDHPNANLYYATRDGAGWSPPVLMARASTLANYDAGPRFLNHGDLVWVSTTPDWRTRLPRRTRWTGTEFAPPERDPTLDPWENWRDDMYVWDGVLNPDGSAIVLGVSTLDAAGRRGPTDLWAARRQGDTWSEPVRLGAGVNTADTENFQFFSHDGRTLYFVRGFSTYYHVSFEAALAHDAHP